MNKYRIKKVHEDLTTYFYVEKRVFIFWEWIKTYMSFEEALKHLTEQEKRDEMGFKDYSQTYTPKKGYKWKHVKEEFSSTLKIN